MEALLETSSKSLGCDVLKHPTVSEIMQGIDDVSACLKQQIAEQIEKFKKEEKEEKEENCRLIISGYRLGGDLVLKQGWFAKVLSHFGVRSLSQEEVNEADKNLGLVTEISKVGENVRLTGWSQFDRFLQKWFLFLAQNSIGNQIFADWSEGKRQSFVARLNNGADVENELKAVIDACDKDQNRYTIQDIFSQIEHYNLELAAALKPKLTTLWSEIMQGHPNKIYAHSTGALALFSSLNYIFDSLDLNQESHKKFFEKALGKFERNNFTQAKLN